MAYLDSNKIKVFPSAYREEPTDATSSLTTEGHLVDTAIACTDRNVFVKEDDYGNLIIVFQGYRFTAQKNDIVALFPSSSAIYVKARIYGRNTADASPDYYSPTLTGGESSGTDFNPDSQGSFTALDFVDTSTVGYYKILEKVSNVWEIPVEARLVLNEESIATSKVLATNISQLFRTEKLENGRGATAAGNYSHAEGINTLANGAASHAEGEGTTASEPGAHSEGTDTSALSAYSHAEGSETQATGLYAHSEGTETIAHGVASHAEGSTTTANGTGSHAEGDTTMASGDYSHAEGIGTIASGEGSHAAGKWNIPSYTIGGQTKYYIESIGGGTDDSHRSNLRSLDEDGNERLSGKLTCDSIDAQNVYAQNGSFSGNVSIRDGLNIDEGLIIGTAYDQQDGLFKFDVDEHEARIHNKVVTKYIDAIDTDKTVYLNSRTVSGIVQVAGDLKLNRGDLILNEGNLKLYDINEEILFEADPYGPWVNIGGDTDIGGHLTVRGNDVVTKNLVKKEVFSSGDTLSAIISFITNHEYVIRMTHQISSSGSQDILHSGTKLFYLNTSGTITEVQSTLSSNESITIYYLDI